MLKRLQGKDLGESMSRRVGYDCITDYAKSSRAMCRVCDRNIEQGTLRLALMLQDEEGYKSAAWTHFECFWKHPETRKLNGTHEIRDLSKLTAADQERVSAEFDKLKSNGARQPKKRKARDDSDDEESVKQVSKPARRKRRA